jgi:hypothetical protein
MRLPWFRTLSVVLVITLSIMLAVPPPAEADPMTALAIAGGVVVVLIVVAYLVVASATEGRHTSTERAVWLACAGDECRPIAPVTALPAPLPDRTQQP